MNSVRRARARHHSLDQPDRGGPRLVRLVNEQPGEPNRHRRTRAAQSRYGRCRSAVLRLSTSSSTITPKPPKGSDVPGRPSTFGAPECHSSDLSCLEGDSQASAPRPGPHPSRRTSPAHGSGPSAGRPERSFPRGVADQNPLRALRVGAHGRGTVKKAGPDVRIHRWTLVSALRVRRRRLRDLPGTAPCSRGRERAHYLPSVYTNVEPPSTWRSVRTPPLRV